MALTAYSPVRADEHANARTGGAKAVRTDRYGDSLPEGVHARMGSVRLRHEGVVALAFSPDRKTLASAGPDWKDPTIRIWELATGKELRRLASDQQFIHALKFTPDGKTLIVASRSSVSLWDVATGKRRLSWLNEHGAKVTAISPDGQTLASCYEQGRIELWEAGTGKPLRALPQIPVTRVEILTLAFSPDGKTLAGKAKDQIIGLWDLPTGKLLRHFPGRPVEVRGKTRSWSPALAFSPDGTTLASPDVDDKLRVWTVNTGTKHQQFNVGPVQGRFSSISPDGSTLALVDGSRSFLSLWDIPSGKRRHQLHLPQGQISCLAFSADSALLATAANDLAIRLWDVAKGQEVSPGKDWLFSVTCIAFSPDSKTLASGCCDGTIRFWEPATGKELHRWHGDEGAVRSIAFTPDGQIVASASTEGTIRLWDVPTGKERHQLRGHDRYASCIGFSRDGRTLFSGGEEGTIRCWDISSGKEIQRWLGHKDGVLSLAVSPQGKLLATGGRDNTIRLWDLATGKEIRHIPCHQDTGQWGVPCVAFAPDGKLLATGCNNSAPTTAHLWEVATGQERVTCSGLGYGLASIDFAPSGEVLVLGGTLLTLAEPATGRILRRVTTGQVGASDVAFAPNGKLLAAVAGDGTILVWEVRGLIGKL
jgi:WD40 repeat protein